MPPKLLQRVEAEILPLGAPVGGRISRHLREPGYDAVDLRVGELVLRVMRELTQFYAHFQAASDPLTWFDLATVLRYLGREAPVGETAKDLDATLRRLRDFLATDLVTVEHLFSREVYPQAKPALLRIRKALGYVDWKV